jgi:hypothetical protein
LQDGFDRAFARDANGEGLQSFEVHDPLGIAPTVAQRDLMVTGKIVVAAGGAALNCE